MKKLLIPAVMLLVFLTGCNAKQTPQIDSAEISHDRNTPLDKIEATPVVAPEVYRFGPCVGRAIILSNTEIMGEKEEFAMGLKYSTIEKNDQLFSHLAIEAWGDPENMQSSQIPIAEMSVDTDKRGVVKNMTVTTPFVDHYQITDPATVAIFDNLAQELSKMRIELPEGGVITGDNLMPYPLSGLDFLFEEPLEGNPYYTLEGEFTQDGVRYVKAVLDHAAYGTFKDTGDSVRVIIHAESIMLKENMDGFYGLTHISIIKDNGEVLGDIFQNHMKLTEAPIL